MRVHHYTPTGIDTIDVEPDKRLSEVIEVEEDVRLFAVSDDGTELEIDAIIREVTAVQVLRVVSHPRQMLEITALYAGRATSFSVSPGMRVGAVLAEAVRRLHIDAVDAADLGLRTIGGDTDLPVDEPIGQVSRTHHHLELQLVAMVHPQG